MKWHCKRCNQEVNMEKFRCGCVESPSPWYLKENELVPSVIDKGFNLCSRCGWTTVGLLNLANKGESPVYMCHGCIKM